MVALEESQTWSFCWWLLDTSCLVEIQPGNANVHAHVHAVLSAAIYITPGAFGLGNSMWLISFRLCIQGWCLLSRGMEDWRLHPLWSEHLLRRQPSDNWPLLAVVISEHVLLSTSEIHGPVLRNGRQDLPAQEGKISQVLLPERPAGLVTVLEILLIFTRNKVWFC